MTTVLNIRNNPNWKKDGATYIGRGSPFGNPFHIGKDGTRAEVIEKYSEYFYDLIKCDFDFWLQVKTLQNETLACYCRPIEGFQGQLLCHGQVIAGYLDQVEPEEIT